MKAPFRIGDYVEVTAEVVTVRAPSESGGNPWKKLERRELHKPLRGWIVGAIRRFEGKVVGGYSYDGDAPVLRATKSYVLWKVAQSMLNRPVECFVSDVRLIERPLFLNDRQGWTPMRLGTPWETAADCGWTPDKQREEMKSWPRDSKGRWIKKETKT